MKKIPTLFERVFENNKVVSISNKVTPGMQWVLEGQGVATVKHDGACCAIINGELYKRYDAKKGKKPPEGAVIPCCNPDPVTGHHPHWVKVDAKNPSDKWFIAAYENTKMHSPFRAFDTSAGVTYEAIGPHFQGNPYKLPYDRLIRHGEMKIEVVRSFEGIFEFLRTAPLEGIVFWKDGEPMCKIKRTDFGFEWPVKEE